MGAEINVNSIKGGTHCTIRQQEVNLNSFVFILKVAVGNIVHKMTRRYF